MREDIPQLFGLTFNTGLWQSSHVHPKISNHQFLLVTLNKQGEEANHQYHDYFIDDSSFHYHSQRNSALSSAKGQAIVNHQKNIGDVYLFVRPTKLAGKKTAPFTCPLLRNCSPAKSVNVSPGKNCGTLSFNATNSK